MSFERAIKDEAHRLGFQFIGITTPDPAPHLSTYNTWLELGRHGEMEYLATEQARQRRADPRQILPECQSIVVLGIPYDAPPVKVMGDNSGKPRGRIASYAWAEDYHNVLPDRMGKLVNFIEAKIGYPIPNRWYTDTGPILERDLAQRAGLGWIGKNTCLIDPRGGSYYFLAEILLGIELEPDPPFEADRCGRCTRCLDACPTSCILPDRTLDARRCISYLTIEHKTAIPLEMRTQIGDWIFGCDICQMVCPWNIRFADPHGDPAFSAHSNIPHPELASELSLSPSEFNFKFKGSPVKRAKRRGYLRNVAIALGNYGDEKWVPALEKSLLSESEHLIRSHAAWALGQIGGEQAQKALIKANRNEQDTLVLKEIRTALDNLSV